MAEKEQNVTLFNNPTLTLLEVKMKLWTALRVVGKLFTPPRHNTKSTSPSPGPEVQTTPNKLRKRNQHYHLIRKVTGERESIVTSDHVHIQVEQWNDTISSKRMGKARQVKSEIDQDQYDPFGGERIPWKSQIGELERWATELEMRMEEVNRHTDEVLQGTQEIMRGTLEMMKGTSRLRSGAMELLRRVDELEEREMEMEKGLENMMEGAEEMMKGAELMEKKADELKRNVGGPDNLQEGTSKMVMGGDHSPVHIPKYKSPTSPPMDHRISHL